MKRNELSEIKKNTVEEIVKRIKVAKLELEGLVLDKNRNKLKDLKSLSKKKKDMAQMLTILGQKRSLEELKQEGAKK